MSDELCDICHQPKRGHSATEFEQCWAKIEARDRYQEISKTLLYRRAITPETCAVRFGSCFYVEYQEGLIPEIQEFLESADISLFLSGDYGTGKTHLARCLLNRAISRGWYVCEAKAVDFAKAGRMKFGQDNILEMMRNSRLILIDDLDKATWDAPALQALWSIIDARYDAKRKTILTSNITPADCRITITQDAPGFEGTVLSMFQRFKPTKFLEFVGMSLR